MILEGYKVENCSCGQPQSLEFFETDLNGEPRFLILCAPCGKGTSLCKTKEQAVHAWNKANSILLG